MNEINDGGRAFPSEQGETSDGRNNQTYDPGMSCRWYFAAHAPSYVVNHGDMSTAKANQLLGRPDNHNWTQADSICLSARLARMYADALMEELHPKQPITQEAPVASIETAKRISDRIHDAGCWETKFILEVLTEELNVHETPVDADEPIINYPPRDEAEEQLVFRIAAAEEKADELIAGIKKAIIHAKDLNQHSLGTRIDLAVSALLDTLQKAGAGVGEPLETT